MNNSDITSKTTSSSASQMALDVKPKLLSNTKSHHKRRPKPKGKHNRPQIVPPSQDSQELSVKPKKSTKSEFVTVTHGLRKLKKKWKYQCNICSVMSDTQASTNNHYRSNHPPIKCSGCPKVFNNLNSPRRHKYCHTLTHYLSNIHVAPVGRVFHLKVTCLTINSSTDVTQGSCATMR